MGHPRRALTRGKRPQQDDARNSRPPHQQRSHRRRSGCTRQTGRPGLRRRPCGDMGQASLQRRQGGCTLQPCGNIRAHHPPSSRRRISGRRKTSRSMAGQGSHRHERRLHRPGPTLRSSVTQGQPLRATRRINVVIPSEAQRNRGNLLFALIAGTLDARRMPQYAESAIDPVRLLRRVFWRLIPFLFLLYVCAYLDRVNLSFAALSMRRELGFSGAVYGAGAGLFFVSYALFEIPANLVLLRLGPRRWIAIITIAWGIISSGMALIHSAASFYLLRFFLGAAEAGFFPGVIMYLTYWFPLAYRARAIARFTTASAIAGVIGAPLSIYLLRLDGFAHIVGWKWLFIGEGLPSIVLGVIVFFVLVDRPEDAAWLSPAEREWLQNELAANSSNAITSNSTGNGTNEVAPTLLTQAFRESALWMLAFIYFAISVGVYSVALWLPVVVKSLTHDTDVRVIAL